MASTKKKNISVSVFTKEVLLAGLMASGGAIPAWANKFFIVAGSPATLRYVEQITAAAAGEGVVFACADGGIVKLEDVLCKHECDRVTCDLDTIKSDKVACAEATADQMRLWWNQHLAASPAPQLQQQVVHRSTSSSTSSSSGSPAAAELSADLQQQLAALLRVKFTPEYLRQLLQELQQLQQQQQPVIKQQQQQQPEALPPTPPPSPQIRKRARSPSPISEQQQQQQQRQRSPSPSPSPSRRYVPEAVRHWSPPNMQLLMDVLHVCCQNPALVHALTPRALQQLSMCHQISASLAAAVLYNWYITCRPSPGLLIRIAQEVQGGFLFAPGVVHGVTVADLLPRTPGGPPMLWTLWGGPQAVKNQLIQLHRRGQLADADVGPAHLSMLSLLSVPQALQALCELRRDRRPRTLADAVRRAAGIDAGYRGPLCRAFDLAVV